MVIFLFENCKTVQKTTTTTSTTTSKIQFDRWQQRVEYNMDVDFDDTKHQYAGKQKLVFHNNSPDELPKVFYHLYMNAFQPGSTMDIRSRLSPDADPRVTDRISKLKPEEMGYLKVKSLTMNGKKCDFKTEGTILEVTLPEKIAPLSKATFEMEFDGQVALQIRRNGRMSSEGVDYSMAQWYPKMCNYDEQGWHANPYIGREFYGIWGDYDVTLHINQRFMVGGTGVLQNVAEVGKGYGTGSPKADANGKLKWHFVAKNVHDFMWGADPDYKHVTKKADDGTLMHFFYIPSEKTAAWEQLPDIMAKVFAFNRDNFGQYPWSDYAFVQGGDGGMEYPMSTLITGERPLSSLVGVSVHELFHSWYQGALASNESLYAWMDEGFTSYASNYTMNYLKKLKLIKGEVEEEPMLGDVARFTKWQAQGREEPLSIHADHYVSNTAYSIGAYTKGAVFLEEIKYIIGEENFQKGILQYFNTWKMKHPNPNDVIRVFEKVSNLELDWFKEYYVYTTKQIDYGIVEVSEEGAKTQVLLKRDGAFPMPLDITVIYSDGSKEQFYAPLDLMRGEKPNENPKIKRTILPDWAWAYPGYEFEIPAPKSKVSKIVIDESRRLADVNRDNNVWMNK
ncbi:MAG: M1 family metallopeptidase [Saprospiraceae bacterium]|nr:M1 family metallopeptidase [Saprospiraceae bacterium]